MATFETALILLFIFAFNCASGQQNCLATCRTVCDDQVPLDPVSRGKKGPKGEKGNTGMPGQKGETNRHVTSKLAGKIERLEMIVGQQSSLIAENSMVIENQRKLFDQQSLLIENQSLLLRNNSFTVENLSLVIKEQSELLKKNSVLIDQLSSCEVTPIENSSNNVTSVLRHNESTLLRHDESTLLRHGDAVKYRCGDGYVPVGAAVRRCQRGKLQPFGCVDVCSQTPCKNNGKCSLSLDVENFYTCTCDLPFFGKKCEKEHCRDTEPCLNGGSCEQTTNGTGYKCTCLPRYYGDSCQFEYCKDLNPCLNGGSCSTNDTEYICLCKYGFGGVNCEIDNCFRFEIPSSTGNYYEAKNICVNRGGEIASRLLGNDGLNYHSEIRRVMHSSRHNVWIGATDSGSEGTWKFTNGEPATGMMFSWTYGEPNNSGNQDCAVVGTNFKLDDQSCYSIYHHVLCQVPNNQC